MNEAPSITGESVFRHDASGCCRYPKVGRGTERVLQPPQADARDAELAALYRESDADRAQWASGFEVVRHTD